MSSLFRMSVALIVLMAFPPAMTADDEIAARSLLGEAEKLIELALPQEALPILDRVQSEYPTTEAALFAGLRRAQALMFLHEYDAAIEVATEIVSANPGTTIACWAQCVIGQSLVKLGRTAEGVEALQEVGPMLPDDTDLGPLNEAREVLGRVCAEYVAEGRDDLDAVKVMRWDPTDHGAAARVLAMLAVHRARQGDFAAAKETLAKVEILYPSETAEIAWAKAEKGLYGLQAAEAQGSTVLNATDPQSLLASSSYTSPQEAARSYISLARYYRRKGDRRTATALLETARDRYIETANAPEILYQLGAVLYVQGRIEEARAALGRIPLEWPRSGYAAPALYLIGANALSHRSESVASLRELTSRPYPPAWRALAWYELGKLLRANDPIGARVSYEESLKLYQWILANQRADIDLGWDWREGIQAQIEVLEHEIEILPKGAGR